MFTRREYCNRLINEYECQFSAKFLCLGYHIEPEIKAKTKKCGIKTFRHYPQHLSNETPNAWRHPSKVTEVQHLLALV